MRVARVMMGRHRGAAALLALALALTACGGDGDGGGTSSNDDSAVSDDTDDTGSDDTDDDTNDTGSDDEASDGEVHEWDYVLFVGLEHHFGQLAEEFADDVRERTDGQVDITVRPAGELPYSADEYLSRVGDGSIHMADALATFMAGECRVGAMPALPMLVPDFESFDEMWPILEPDVDSCTDNVGADMLYTYLWPSQNIWGSGDAPQSLDDLSGLTIRQTSSEHGTLIESVGGEPVTLTTEEVPAAIQRGVMDGLITAALNAWSAGWYEFLDWGYLIEAGVIPSYILVNQDALAELPEDLRTEVTEAAEDATERNNQATIEAEQEARDKLASEGGVELVEVPQEERDEVAEMLTDLWESWAQDVGASDTLDEVRDTLGR